MKRRVIIGILSPEHRKLRSILVIGVCAYIFLAVVQESAVKQKKPVVYPARGRASWYEGRERLTANGEVFSPAALTCAMRRRDFGAYYTVCNVRNNACVIVRHNDFGPAALWYHFDKRIVDLSREAFSQIADTKAGVVEVTVTRSAAASP